MTALNKREPFLLFIGDIVVFYVSLWLTLLIRYQYIPQNDLLNVHVIPFSILFIVWFLILFIGGLYEKRITILRHKLPSTILKTQLVNSVIAVLFFYFIPIFGITPKTILFIYLVVSFILMLVWRIYGQVLFGARQQQHALLIAGGKEMKELHQEVNANKHYSLHIVSAIDLDVTQSVNFEKEVIEKMKQYDASMLIVDFRDNRVETILPHLYNLIFTGVIFVDMHKVYEDVFDRIPLSLIKYSWFLEHISLAPKKAYDALKRVMDIVVSLVLGILSLVIYPWVCFVIKYQDGGPIFITQHRVGQNGKFIKTIKFRSMTRNEVDLTKGGDNKVTPFGKFMRKTRIDELPQLWNVIRGDLSLIGPRPELPSGVSLYEKEIPYYGIRHLIKPGLSGWAQIYHDNHPHHGLEVDATKEKLSYDLYYIKNRSFMLDVIIALRTIKKMMSRSGI
jgi:exopolysaccharide biosynthesis polyprenyl glycosylphosphotransferase